MGKARNLSKLSSVLTTDGAVPAAKGGTGTTTGAASGGSSPTISAITYPGDDTAVNTNGGDTVTLTGTNFNTGVKVVINGSEASVVSRISSTQLTFIAPAQATGSYIIYVVNTDGSTALAVPGLQYSPIPVWTTAAGSLGTYVKNLISFTTTLTATGNAPITYSVASGNLPSGVTLNSSTGVLSGTTPDVAVSTTYSFTIRSTDAQNQDTDRAFSLTVVPSNAPPTVEYLVVAGGGGGGSNGGGGGAGGYRTATGLSITPGVTATVTVGAGGAAGTQSVANATGANGSNSVFDSITSLGGGGGSGYKYSTAINTPAKVGGSGGGGGATGTNAAGTAGQGNAGAVSTSFATGGGGGAGGAGITGDAGGGGAGGVGLASSITGTSVIRAGGGGGGGYCNYPNPGAGGAGGGGAGGRGTLNPSGSIAGTANTGGGGGGSSETCGSIAGTGAAGGSGIVVIRYADNYDAATATTGNPTVTVSGGYRVYIWTTSGSITF